jgi:uncharacterized membrane protein
MVNAATLHRVLLVVLLIGLGLSVYSAIETTFPNTQACNVTSYVSCGAVDSSGHTTTFGVQDYWFGIGGFALLLALDLPFLLTYDVRFLYGILGLGTVGVLIALYFGSVEVLVIHALCPVCFGSYVADGVALAVALQLWRLRRSAARASAPDPEPRPPPGEARSG